jgi:hypothetical protein
MGHHKLSIGTCAFCVDNTFRNTLAVEVGKEIDKMKVLEQKGSILSNPIRCLGVGNRTTVRSSVDAHVDIRTIEFF